MSKKSKGAKGKKVDLRGGNREREVIIFIGLVEWNESSECLKRKHGKRMALKVNRDDPPAVLLQKAVEKWKAYFSNYFDLDEDYVLLLEDYKEATFLPGSGKEFFTLERYQEELGKDFKRITLFLCTLTDFRMSEGEATVDGDEVINLPETVYPVENHDSNPSDGNRDGDKVEVSTDAEQKHSITAALEDDFVMAQAIQASLENVSSGKIQESPAEATLDKEVTYSDHISVIQSLEQHVTITEQFFLVVRRGVPFQRVISLWQRESNRTSPENRVRVKYLGEDGIDSGALAREFFSDTIAQIGTTLFPGGAPVDSTFYVRNGTFRTAGEIVATSWPKTAHPQPFLTLAYLVHW